ncbi:MAG: hypothetical protein R3338_07035 [Thermoanaerobaculia bacterium]|nr:hypothetical protein [Thermoanaerobaculia bacterium]
MAHHLFLLRRPLSPELWDQLDRSGNMIACAPSAVEDASDALLDLIVGRKSMLISCTVAGLAGKSLSVGLVSDLFAIREGASIRLDGLDPVGMAGLVWRIGRSAIPLIAVNDEPLDAERMIREGIADVVVPEGIDPLEWVRSWLGRRSLAALTSAARLVRSGGGERVERAEFARLFAAGVPAEGLSAFLERRPARFEEELIVETI